MSSWSSLPAVALLACALSAALLLPPRGVFAQRPPEPQGQSLNAAIEEARRSAFWTVGHSVPLQAADSPVHDGSAPPSRQENSRDGAPNDEPRHLGIATILGIAVGDIGGGLVAGSLCDDDELGSWFLCLGLISSPVTAAANLTAGAPPGAALLGSFLGTGLGFGAGYVVLKALEEPLYILAPIPALITYYAVRFGVTLGTVRRLAVRG